MPQFPMILKALEPFWDEWFLVERIGIGSYGQVFCVQSNVTGQKAALKWVAIPKDESEEDSTLQPNTTEEQKRQHYLNIAQTLMKEVRLMEKFPSNAHIVRIIKSSIEKRDGGVGCDLLILMELLVPLRKAYPNGIMSVAETEKLGHDICSALSACEAQKIIHRDVKPENIFLDDQGNYKLGDFGVAKQMVRTMGGSTVIGTPLFMAPEMMSAVEDDYGVTVDLYALGLVMHRYLNFGLSPFLPIENRLFSVEENDAAYKRRMKGEQIPPAIDAPPYTNAVIQKACAFNPNDRFQSADEMQKALLEKTIPMSNYDNPPPRRPPYKYHLFAFFAILTIAIGGWFVLAQPKADSIQVTIQYLDMAGNSIAPSQELILENGTHTIVPDESGIPANHYRIENGADKPAYYVVTVDDQSIVPSTFTFYYEMEISVFENKESIVTGHTPKPTPTIEPTPTFAPEPTSTLIPKPACEISQSPAGIRLQWEEQGSATGYRIYRSKNDDNDFVCIDAISNHEKSYVDSSIKANTVYRYYFTSLSDIGESQPSETKSMIWTQKSDISNLRVSLDEYDIRSFHVSWDDIVNSEYNVSIYLLNPKRDESWYWSGMSFTEHEMVYERAVPNATYQVIVHEEVTGIELEQTITIPKAPSYKNFGCKSKGGKLYWISRYEVNNWIDPWEADKRSAGTIQLSAVPDLRNEYYLYFVSAFTYTKESQTHSVDELFVMRTPSGRIYFQDNSGWANTIDASKKNWTWEWHTDITTILYDLGSDSSQWEKGKYTIEQYFDGCLVNTATFTIK